MVSILHSEFCFKNGVKTKNRFVLAPMTTSQSLVNGRLSADDFLWMKQFAQGGFGIIISCAAHTSLEGQGWQNQLGIFDDHFIPPLKILTDSLKHYGSRAILQICHAGLRSASAITGIPALNVNTLSSEKIKSLIKEFGEAAARAESAGFDGIELHGANGYLITQFISVQTNHRTDNYGGSLENRARFLLDVLEECRKNVSRKFLIGVRLSPENFGEQTGLKLSENLQIAKWLRESQNADYLHISTWDALKKPLNSMENLQALSTSLSREGGTKTESLLSLFRNVLGDFPILIAGGIQMPTQCAQVLDEGADFIALGKVAIGNPYYPVKSQNPFYKPNLPPYSHEYLQYCSVSELFRTVLKKFTLA